MLSFITGYKTYIVCALTLIYAGVSLYLGSITTDTAIQIALAALGAAGLRSGITTAAVQSAATVIATRHPAVSDATAANANPVAAATVQQAAETVATAKGTP
jgi:fructose-specific phosphotransferase system component IIB